MHEFRYSDASEEKLKTVDPRLVRVLRTALSFGIIDIAIREGHRGKEAQDKAFADGNSKLQWPNGKHNKMPSEGVDIDPSPIDWEDTERYCMLAGVMMVAAELENVKIRWGGDWDSDGRLKEEKFRDYGHFELA